MKIAIVVGHNSKSQGAIRVTDGRTEFDWNGELAELIRTYDEDTFKVFRRSAGGGYSAEIDRVYAETDAWGADLTLELHFNGSSSSSASGCETLSSGTAGSTQLARLVQSACLSVLKNRDRGLVVRRKYERGGRSLWAGKAPAVLLEPYFGSNAAECALAQHKMSALAKAIADAAKSWS